MRLARHYFAMSRLIAISCVDKYPVLKLHGLMCSMHEQEVVLQRRLYIPQANAADVVEDLSRAREQLLIAQNQFLPSSFLYLNCTVLCTSCDWLLAVDTPLPEAQPVPESAMAQEQQRRIGVLERCRIRFDLCFNQARHSPHMRMIVLIKEIQLYHFRNRADAMEERILRLLSGLTARGATRVQTSQLASTEVAQSAYDNVDWMLCMDTNWFHVLRSYLPTRLFDTLQARISFGRRFPQVGPLPVVWT